MAGIEKRIRVGGFVSPASLVGRKLDGFSIQKYTEVYKIDDDGRKQKSLGHFKDPAIAKAFAGHQTDSVWHKTEAVLLLTDGKVGFIIGESVKLVDNEKVALEVKEAALKKLTPEERKILDV